MAITKAADVQATPLYIEGDITTGNLSVTKGDMIVVCAMSEASTKTADSCSDSGSGSNSYTGLTGAGGNRIFYAVADTTETITITVDFAAVKNWATVHAYAMRPGSGTTIEYDDEPTAYNKAGNYTSALTGEWDLGAADSVAVSAAYYGSGALSDPEIPDGTNADGYYIQDDDNLGSSYKIFTTKDTGVEAKWTFPTGWGTTRIVAASFKAVASGGTTHQLSGSVDSASVISGVLNLTQCMSGSLNSYSHTSGVLRLIQRLTGSLNSVSHIIGNLRIPGIQSLSGVIQSISAMTGKLNLTQSISASLNTASSTSGRLRLIQRLSASLNSNSVVSGTIRLIHGLKGSLQSISAMTGKLNLTQKISGVINSVSSLTGKLNLIQRISGSILTISHIIGTLVDETIAQGMVRIVGIAKSLKVLATAKSLKIQGEEKSLKISGG